MNGSWKFRLVVSGLALISISPGVFSWRTLEARADETGDLACPGCNLVIISLTNTRKDHLGVYGYKRRTSPNIDAFFTDALVLENAFAPASWTLPVTASLFTSLFPYTHGVMNRYNDNTLADNTLTLAELLKSQGYQTAGFTGGGDYNRKFNVAQGFDMYLDEVNYGEYGLAPSVEEAKARNLAYLGIERLTPMAIEWLTKHKDDRFFLLLQGYDTHCPFTPKPPFDKAFDSNYDGKMDFSTCLWTFGRTEPEIVQGERRWPVKTSVIKDGLPTDQFLTDRDVSHMLALYDGEIAQADDYLGKLFSAVNDMKLADKTIFIFMAEHGDLFGEHGRFMRGGPLRGTFFDPVLNFPLLIRHPKVKGLVRVNSLAQSVDFLPTLTEILQIEDPRRSEREGKSLLPAFLMPDRETGVNKHVFAGSLYTACNNVFFSGTSVVETVRNNEWKLMREAIYDPDTGQRLELRFELFNLHKDPSEEQDVYAMHREIADDLERILRERFPRPPVDDSAPPCTGGPLPVRPMPDALPRHLSPPPFQPRLDMVPPMPPPGMEHRPPMPPPGMEEHRPPSEPSQPAPPGHE